MQTNSIFYVLGHCVTPVAYHFDPETARFILEEFNSENVNNFLEDYTSYSSHQIGSQESYLFAKNISDLWRDFGVPTVEISQVKNKITQPDVKIPSKITIIDQDGKPVFVLDITHEKDLVSFTPPGTAMGQLVYGHFGQFDDLTTLQRYLLIRGGGSFSKVGVQTILAISWFCHGVLIN